MISNQILWVTTIIMLADGLLILAAGKRRTASQELRSVLHGLVPIIAACSYLRTPAGRSRAPLMVRRPGSQRDIA